MTGIVQKADGVFIFRTFKYVKAAIVLTAPPEVRVVQSYDGAQQNFTDDPMGDDHNSLAFMFRSQKIIKTDIPGFTRLNVGI